MKATVALLLIYVFAELVVLANAMFIAVVLRPEEFPLLPLSLGVLLSVPGILLLRFCWHRRVLGYAGALVLGTVGLLIELISPFLPAWRRSLLTRRSHLLGAPRLRFVPELPVSLGA